MINEGIVDPVKSATGAVVTGATTGTGTVAIVACGVVVLTDTAGSGTVAKGESAYAEEIPKNGTTMTNGTQTRAFMWKDLPIWERVYPAVC